MQLGRALIWLLVAICLIYVCSAQISLADEQVAESKDAAKTSRSQFRLPRMFDFENYKRLFNKHYPSVMSEIARRKLFMARAFRAFTSSVAYMYKKVSSYRKINPMSDWTPQEIRSIYVAKDSPEDAFAAVVSEKPAPELDELEVADVDEVVDKLKYIEQHANEPEFSLLAQELHKAQGESRRKRDARSDRRDFSIDDLIPVAGSKRSSELPEKFMHRVPSNNPDYQQPEVVTFGDEEDNFQDALSRTLADDINKTPGNSFLSGLLRQYSSVLQSMNPLSGMIGVKNAEPKQEEQLPDEMTIDLRDHGCFLEPRAQGKCGSCYSFAGISLYEFAYCMQTDQLTAFSEQYMIDCGPLPSFEGCNGGFSKQTGYFVKDFGLELRANYPYRGRKDECPFVEPAKRGYLKAATPELYLVTMPHLKRYLDKSPALITVALSESFSEYGGGVDECKFKEGMGAHAMLVVGHGREDGKEFWLIRNSHGIYWGEQGYYKLEVGSDCIKGGNVAVSKALVDKKPLLKANTKYDPTPVKRKYGTFFLEQLKSSSEAKRPKSEE